MTEKTVKITTNLLDVVQLIDEDEVASEMGTAFASFMLNPTVTWAKFVLTDDRKNANGQRIPKEEFVNLLRSGIHMPVKMANSELDLNHEDSRPLGTITHLKEVENEDGTASIIALAALWGSERPLDVKTIRQKFQEKTPIDVSWEIIYREERFNETFASKDLLGTALRAATIVGNPAYKGRTPFLAIASEQVEQEKDESNKPDSDKFAEDELNELEKLQQELAQLKADLETKDATIAELTAQKEALQGEVTELASLREYKASIEAETLKAERLDAIKAKFVEAGIQKDEEYFATNAEKLVEMSDDYLDFMIQELKAFAAAVKETSASDTTNTTKVPNLVGSDDEDDLSNPKTLGKRLRERGKK